MGKPKKDLSKESKATLKEMLDYLCSKINFGDACLDSTAIRCMDILFKKLSEDSRIFDLE